MVLKLTQRLHMASYALVLLLYEARTHNSVAARLDCTGPTGLKFWGSISNPKCTLHAKNQIVSMKIE